MSIKLGINGFGRIGRLAFRYALNNPEVEITAINDLTDTATMAHLLAYDSVHGKLKNKVILKDNFIEVNGKKTFLSSTNDPEKIKWKEVGVDIVAECTGIFRKRQDAAKHLSAGAKKVIISAPSPDTDLTVVMGVNSTNYDSRKHDIVSNASCTTNCLAPVCKVLLENFGIESGLMTTIHSYTGAQNLVDLPHKDLRRARAAALSMIPTTTGAAKAVSLVLPELAGKLNGMAIRIPTPTVSIIDLVVQLKKGGVTASDVNNAMKHASENSLTGILGYTDLPLVSSDFKGETLSSIVDGLTTYEMNGMIKILAWYDNESGYAARMIDLAEMMGKQF